MTDPRDTVAAALADRYEFEGEIGHGGMATVFRARDRRHGSIVAIKVLRPELVVALGGERFTREVRITAALQHPHILPLLDSGEANGLPYYVMPFVEGASLAQRLEREGPLPIRDAVRFVVEIADGLAYAHKLGLIHRDIKPANILLSQDHALLADFGIARILDTGGTEVLTDSGLALGTATYMSPEQSAGERVDARTDIYALGCVLYELLTGSPPFTGSSQRAIMARHAVNPVPSVRTVRREVPLALEAAISRALAKTAGDRFADMDAFHTAIVDALAMLGTAEVEPVKRPRRLWTGAALVVTAIAAALFVVARRPAAVVLDAARIMVYPLVLPSNWQGASTAGEDVSTMIGSAMDGAGALRWLDGWQLLAPGIRDNMRALSDSAANELARLHRCRYVVTGRLAVLHGDSSEVLLTLRDLEDTSLVARPRAVALASEVWRAGLRAVGSLLPSLIRSGETRVPGDWNERNPQAVASFLAGEAAFRRVQLDAALAHFKAAVTADSAFGLAALRGAQVALWGHHDDDAGKLAARATRYARTPRERAFAAGLAAYIRGQADSAVTALRAALAIDPEMSVAWLQLSETYAHLLPSTGNPDSLAAAALTRALELDSTATHLLFHEVQLAARAGDSATALKLADRFVAGAADSTLREEVSLIASCLRGGWTPKALRDAAQRHPRELQIAAVAFGLTNPACYRDANATLLAVDTMRTSAVEGRAFYAIAGLIDVYLARGVADSARTALDAFVARWGFGASLYLMNAPVAPGLAPDARRVATADSVRYGFGYKTLPFNARLWMLGGWAAADGQRATAEAVASELALRAGRTHATLDSVMAESMAARVAVLRGDTAAAVDRLRALSRRAVPQDLVTWSEAGSLGYERLLLGRLLLARKQPAEARAVLEVLSSGSPALFPLFTPAALTLRLDAADLLGDGPGSARIRRQLARATH